MTTWPGMKVVIFNINVHVYEVIHEQNTVYITKNKGFSILKIKHIYMYVVHLLLKSDMQNLLWFRNKIKLVPIYCIKI